MLFKICFRYGSPLLVIVCHVSATGPNGTVVNISLLFGSVFASVIIFRIVFFVIPLNIVVLCVSQNIVVHQLLTSLLPPISGDCMESKITHRLHLMVIF